MQTPAELADLVAAMLAREGPHLRAIPDGPDTARPNRPSGVGWSQREELGHLIDSAVNNHNRFVRAGLDGRYEGPGYEQDGWVAAHGYAAMPWPALVEIWARHNEILVPVLRALPAERLDAPCAVGGAPPIPLRRLIEEYVVHAQHHLDQVLRRAAVTPYTGG